jgi:hypothetical protein
MALLCFRPTGRENLWNIFARNVSSSFSEAKVQEEELDCCRAAGERGAVSEMWVAGRNQSGFSLSDF